MAVNQSVNIDLAKQKYLKFYKNNLVKAAVAQLDQNFIYEPTKGISEEEFLKTQIYTKIIFRSEDMISGAYKGVKFTLSKIISQKREYKSAKSDLANLAILAKALYDQYMDFTGSVLVCEFDKKFSFKTIIVSKELNAKI